MIEIEPTTLPSILPFRALYRREMNCQIVHDSWHERGFLDAYAVRIDGTLAGYGSVGGLRDEPRDLVKEFYLLPTYRGEAQAAFHALIEASRARRIETQTNDRLLTLMLFDHAVTIERDRILFDDGATTHHAVPDATFRRLTDADRATIFAHEVEPVGDWGIEVDGRIVATGGLMFHYNPPFSDVYMEVGAPWRRRGYGTLLVQELKRVSYGMGFVPAARCAATNLASRATLQRAGLFPCGWILRGDIAEAG